MTYLVEADSGTAVAKGLLMCETFGSGNTAWTGSAAPAEVLVAEAKSQPSTSN